MGEDDRGCGYSDGVLLNLVGGMGQIDNPARWSILCSFPGPPPQGAGSTHIPIAFISRSTFSPSTDRPRWRFAFVVYTADTSAFRSSWPNGQPAGGVVVTHSSISMLIIAVVREGHITHAEPVQHAQRAETISSLMQAFDTDQAGHAARAKGAPHGRGRVGEAKGLGIAPAEAVDDVDLLDRLPETFQVAALRDGVVDVDLRAKRDGRTLARVASSSSLGAIPIGDPPWDVGAPELAT